MDEPPKKTVPVKDRYTYADYLEMPEGDGHRYQILDGELAVSATPATPHQYACGRLYLLLDRWAERYAGGLVFFAPLAVLLSDDNVLEPDVMWIAPDRITEIAGKIIRGAPDLVVEVASPSTVRFDRVKKLRIYARFGVREYWLVDPGMGTVEILALESGGYRIHASGAGSDRLASALDPRLEVVPETLFREF
jgi:Uma2 family endonuclease